jgi:CHAT domain-containing protein
MSGRALLTVDRFLETDGLGRPRLDVLSACVTGLYDINRNPTEFIGAGTFTALEAGVLGTLWPVSDAATALLVARCYELHLAEGLAPPTALRRAQMWLRQASNADLAGYARIAASQGRLGARHVDEMARELSAEGLALSRNNALVEWTTPGARRGPSKKNASDVNRIARPYAHPYFWGGFIYTGL